jgi:beta-lactamase superfamily II metal-dependent hydrolase
VLTFYFVDTEGGQSTLILLPNQQVLIVDTGNPGERDTGRIARVLTEELGKTHIDYLLTTHYDIDHWGGVPGLAEQFSVGQYLDHGDTVYDGGSAPAAYLELAQAGERRILEVGDEVELGEVTLDIVSSNAEVLSEPLPGVPDAANPHCEGAAVPSGNADENSSSVGFVLRFGSFEFLDLADLLFVLEDELACPVNLLGQVDLYLTTHHGLTRSGAPQLVAALEAQAAVMNNGPRKGGGGTTWDTLAAAPGGMEVWQLHRVLTADADQNAPVAQIANLEEGGADEAHYLRVVARSSGAFSVFNPRTELERQYPAR